MVSENYLIPHSWQGLYFWTAGPHHLGMPDVSKVFVTIYCLIWSFATLVKAEHKNHQQAVTENQGQAFIFFG